MLNNYFGDMSYFSREKNEDKVYENQGESLTDLHINIIPWSPRFLLFSPGI